MILCTSGLLIGGAAFMMYMDRELADPFEEALSAWERTDLQTIRHCKAQLEQMPDREPHVHLLEGMILMTGGRLFESVEQFGQATEHSETQLLAYSLAGQSLYKLRRFTDAIGTLNRAIELDPDDAEAHRWLAATYFDLGAMDAAQTHLERLAELVPNDSRPLRLKGLIFRDYERFEEAVEAYSEALKRSPPESSRDQIRFELAQCLSQARRYEESLDAMKPLPVNAERLTLQSLNLFSLGRKQEAMRAIDDALELAPDDPEALTQKADFLLDQNLPEQSLDLLQRSIQSDPFNYVSHLKLSQAYRLLGRTEDADVANKEMQRLQDLRLQFADLHQKAIADPLNADFRFQLGQMALQLGMQALAYDWFEAAVGLDPSHVEAMNALKEL